MPDFTVGNTARTLNSLAHDDGCVPTLDFVTHYIVTAQAPLLDPKLVGALYGRGLAKLRKRDAGGNADIEAAKAIKPDIVEDFARYGLR